jgi:hypothetical protein
MIATQRGDPKAFLLYLRRIHFFHGMPAHEAGAEIHLAML